jgi:hypothetical protein
MKDIMSDEVGAPKMVDRSTFPAELDALRVREKATQEKGDAIAAARRRFTRCRDLRYVARRGKPARFRMRLTLLATRTQRQITNEKKSYAP